MTMPDGFAECRAAVDRVLARRLFFVGGFPKSGTTWVQRLLDAHPGIGCRGEGHLANRLAPALAGALQRHNALLANKQEHIFAGMPAFPEVSAAHARYVLVSAIALLLDAAHPGGKPAIGEKTPDNARHFAALASLFPAAKFVHVVRDPRDCAVSAWFHNHRTNPAETLRRFPTLAAFARFTAHSWAESDAAAAAFIADHPGRCIEPRYEDFLARPRQTLGPAVYFLGADASPALVDACVRAADFATLSGGRARGEEDRAAFFRRGEAGDWRRHLSDAEGAEAKAIAGAAMARHGYG